MTNISQGIEDILTILPPILGEIKENLLKNTPFLFWGHIYITPHYHGESQIFFPIRYPYSYHFKDGFEFYPLFHGEIKTFFQKTYVDNQTKFCAELLKTDRKST